MPESDIAPDFCLRGAIISSLDTLFAHNSYFRYNIAPKHRFGNHYYTEIDYRNLDNEKLWGFYTVVMAAWHRGY